MKVELIPVLDIFYSNEDVESPEKGPFWEYADEWNKYQNECLKKIGMEFPPKPYLNGSSFYEFSDLTDENLEMLIIKHTEDARNNIYPAEDLCALYGGYVLKINDENKYFPQCCADLSNIECWENLLTEKEPYFYQGHPEPNIVINDQEIIFDFSTDEYNEHFVPNIKEKLIKIRKEDLKTALEITKIKVEYFAKRIKEIEPKLDLGVENLEKILIWNNDEN